MRRCSKRFGRTRALLITVALVVAIAMLSARGGRHIAPAADQSDGDTRRTAGSQRVSQRRAELPTLPDVRPGEEERTRTEDWEANVRTAPLASVTLHAPAPGEVEHVRAHRFVPDVQPPSEPAPNPFVPPKLHLSDDDLRAGLAD